MIYSADPTLYGSVFRPVCFELTEVDAPEGLDVRILDMSFRELGAKRFYAQGGLTIDVGPYMRALLAPEPIVSKGHGCHKVPERVAEALLAIGDVTSGCMSMGGTDDTPVGAIGSAAPVRVSIRPGERDEIPLIPREGTTAPKITFTHGGVLHTDLSLGGAPYVTSPLAVVVDVDTVLAAWRRLTGAAYDALAEFTVEVCSEEARIYTLDHYGSGGVRLAWLNRFGGVDYHTFPTVRQTLFEGSRTRVATINGFRTLATAAAQSTRLVSAPCSEGESMWLSEIFSSPVVWRIAGTAFERVEVSAGRVETSPLKPTVVELTIEEPTASVSRKL